MSRRDAARVRCRCGGSCPRTACAGCCAPRVDAVLPGALLAVPAGCGCGTRDVVTEGFVFLGRRRRDHGPARATAGSCWAGGCTWATVTRLRAHEGTLRIGDKTVLGRENTLNCYLDIEVGPRCIVADWVYVVRLRPSLRRPARPPIKDQGIVKSPVRIGADVWVGVKASVLRGARVGDGCVLAAHTVVRGEVPAGSVVAGVPGRVVRDRAAIYAAAAEHRAALADMARKHEQCAVALPLGRCSLRLGARRLGLPAARAGPAAQHRGQRRRRRAAAAGGRPSRLPARRRRRGRAERRVGTRATSRGDT